MKILKTSTDQRFIQIVIWLIERYTNHWSYVTVDYLYRHLPTFSFNKNWMILKISIKL